MMILGWRGGLDFAVMSTVPQSASSSVPTPPIAKQVPTERTHHGDTVTDPYAWLANPKDPEVIAYLEAENGYTEALTEGLGELRSAVFDEIKARTQETDLSVPVRKGNWWRYSRTVEGQQYAISCRRRVRDGEVTPPMPEDGKPLDGEEVLLDGNELAEGKAFFSLGALSVSPDKKRLAYSTDFAGDERYTLRIKDLATGEVLPDEVPDTHYGCAWSLDGSALFYTTVDEAWRPYRVWRHVVGTPTADDVVVFEESDEKFWLGVGTSRDEKWLVIGTASKLTSEVHLLDAANPTGEFSVVAPRRFGVEYDVEVASDRLLILHNDGAENFELASAPLPGSGDTSAWTPVIAHRADTRLLSVDAFESCLMLLLPARRYDRAFRAAAVRRRRGAADHVPRAAVHGRPRVEPGVHADPVPHRLQLDGHPVHGVRLRHRGRLADSAQAAAGAGLPGRGRRSLLLITSSSASGRRLRTAPGCRSRSSAGTGRRATGRRPA